MGITNKWKQVRDLPNHRERTFFFLPWQSMFGSFRYLILFSYDLHKNIYVFPGASRKCKSESRPSCRKWEFFIIICIFAVKKNYLPKQDKCKTKLNPTCIISFRSSICTHQPAHVSFIKWYPKNKLWCTMFKSRKAWKLIKTSGQHSTHTCETSAWSPFHFLINWSWNVFTSWTSIFVVSHNDFIFHHVVIHNGTVFIKGKILKFDKLLKLAFAWFGWHSSNKYNILAMVFFVLINFWRTWKVKHSLEEIQDPSEWKDVENLRSYFSSVSELNLLSSKKNGRKSLTHKCERGDMLVSWIEMNYWYSIELQLIEASLKEPLFWGNLGIRLELCV